MNTRNYRFRRWTAFALGAALVSVSVAAIAAYYALQSDQSERLQTSLYWANLSSLPASAQGVAVEATGNIFTRGFRVSFTAPADDIDAWLLRSPGTNGITPDISIPHHRKFNIAPQGGAEHAELNVDDATQTVSIYAFWS